MNRLRIGLFAIMLAVSLMTSSAQATDCLGDACDDITDKFENGCFVFTNHGTRRVNIKTGGYSFLLQRGEKKILYGLDGRTCANFIWGAKMTANYANSGSSSSPAPPRDREVEPKNGSINERTPIVMDSLGSIILDQPWKQQLSDRCLMQRETILCRQSCDANTFSCDEDDAACNERSFSQYMKCQERCLFACMQSQPMGRRF